MDVLATFPTVQAAGAASPRKVSVSSARAAPRASAPLTILAVIAVVVWAGVWWVEREPKAERQPTTIAATEAAGAERVPR